MSDKPHPHKFRYLLPPGNNFAFVAKFKIWIWISLLLMAISVGSLFFNKAVRGEYMNWTTDFKGGTQIIVSFKDASGTYIKEDPAKIREAFAKAHEPDVELSDISYAQSTPKGDVNVNGMIIVSPRFSALTDKQQQKTKADFMAAFKANDVGKASWSGDRLFVRTKKVINHDDTIAFFKNEGLELKPWTDQETAQYTHADEGTGEFNEVFSIWGVDRQYEKLLEASLGNNTNVTVEQSYGVGAKAGDKLKDDAAKSIVYALFLIMLYLAFRFDIRYAPGAAFATIHDAVMVIGVFSLTWTPVSLVSVAGLLTVMGYSTNDTVIVFDRIRENQAKLKDKKIERIVDISLNEMLVRTILTSATVFATTLIMNIFGTGDVRNFAFAMNVGVIVGTYSSIFLASPVFMWISRKWYSGPAKKRAMPVTARPAASAPSSSDDE